MKGNPNDLWRIDITPTSRKPGDIELTFYFDNLDPTERDWPWSIREFRPDSKTRRRLETLEAFIHFWLKNPGGPTRR